MMIDESFRVLWRADKFLSFAIAVLLTVVSATIGAASNAKRGKPVRSEPYEVVRLSLRPSAEIEPASRPLRIVETKPARIVSGEAARQQLLAEHKCLSEAMYYEARGEGEKGQMAVANVVLNRLAGGEHGRTICAVVYQGSHLRYCQFTFACDGSLNRPKSSADWRLAQILAAQLLTRQWHLEDDTLGATHYHTTAVFPRWAAHLGRVRKIGNHIFYGENAPRLAANNIRGSVQ